MARALIEAGLAQPDRLHRLYYLGPMFRYDRPQAGRYRQFHQWGAEVVGTASPWADVETILLLVDLLTGLGLEGLVVKLNSVGDGTCRPAYQAKLREILTPRRAELCADCQERLDRNPRIEKRRRRWRGRARTADEAAEQQRQAIHGQSLA